MTTFDQITKRTFDLFFASVGLCLLWPLVLLAVPFARYSTGASGIFRQKRIGRYGKEFTLYKLRTMVGNTNPGSTVTARNDSRITKIGAFLRKSKIDELPQLWNVIRGDMSLVGPRPDVRGFADTLTGDEYPILQLRPGITGPASIKYRDEETLLMKSADPEQYNKSVIYPDKIKLNLEYYNSWTLSRDIELLLITLHIMPCKGELSGRPMTGD